MKQIESNTFITASFIGDSQLKPRIQVLERKGNFVFIIVDGKVQRKKIYNNGEHEYVYPYGRYSMAPIAY